MRTKYFKWVMFGKVPFFAPAVVYNKKGRENLLHEIAKSFIKALKASLG